MAGQGADVLTPHRPQVVHPIEEPVPSLVRQEDDHDQTHNHQDEGIRKSIASASSWRGCALAPRPRMLSEEGTEGHDLDVIQLGALRQAAGGTNHVDQALGGLVIGKPERVPQIIGADDDCLVEPIDAQLIAAVGQRLYADSGLGHNHLHTGQINAPNGVERKV